MGMLGMIAVGHQVLFALKTLFPVQDFHFNLLILKTTLQDECYNSHPHFTDEKNEHLEICERQN